MWWVPVLATQAIACLTSEPRPCRRINHHGEYATGLALAVGMFVPLGLALLEVEHFWIASAMYLAFAASGFLGTVVKIVAYRRGLPAW